MSVFRRRGEWVAKFQPRGEQHWVPDGPSPTKTPARVAERRHRERIENGRVDETCAAFAERWLREWPRPASSTRRMYAYAIGRFSADFGPTKLGDVERLSARTWALSVPRDVSRIVGIMYEDARNIGLVDSNPFSNLRLPPSEKTEEVHPPSLEEYRQLLEACTVLGGYGPKFRAIIQFSAWTGARAGELHALRWDDVGEDTVRIRGARKRDGEIGRPKNGKERETKSPAARTRSSSIRRAASRSFRVPTTTRVGPFERRPGSRSTANGPAFRTCAGMTCATFARRSSWSSASTTSRSQCSSATRKAAPS